MTHILRIDSSPRHEASKSRDLADAVVARFEGAEVTQRDISDGLPMVSRAWTEGAYIPEEDRTAEQKDALAMSDELVAEVKAADVLVIGAPMYNFTLSAALKSWFDQIARMGLTFKYTEQGPKGLLDGKRAIVLVATGGVQQGSDYDMLTPYVRHFLGFIGITDVEFIAADGLNGPDAEKSVTDAKAEIKDLETA